MGRIWMGLTALAVAMPAAAALPPNPYADALQRMGELQRRATLRGALVNSNERCRRVDRADFGGAYRNLVMWSVRCSDGGDFGVFIGSDGSAQVRTCTDLAKLKLPTCRLPPAPAAAAPKRPPGHR